MLRTIEQRIKAGLVVIKALTILAGSALAMTLGLIVWATWAILTF